MEEICLICGGFGLQIIERPDGSRAARDCECRIEKRRRRALLAANIPPRYEFKSFANYNTAEMDSNGYTLNHAKYISEKFVDSYPVDTRGIGLLFTGTIGTGKTHLAISVLKALIADKGVTGIFFHFQDLIKKIQNSFNRSVQATEMNILDPILNAEILVLDELGASKPSDWVFDTIAQVLNTRYNERRTTIITTNYANREPNLLPGRPLTVLEESREALRNETLGDRIGERMRSRLQEMCMVVEMLGPDLRDKEERARFG
jgi:DNA replication protein DnaC